MKDYNENKDSLFLQYVDANSLYAWAMCQKLPVKNAERLKYLGYINQKFIRNYDEESSEKGYILKVDAEYSKELQDEHKDLPFFLEKIEINKQKNLHVIFMIKQNMWCTLKYYNHKH